MSSKVTNGFSISENVSNSESLSLYKEDKEVLKKRYESIIKEAAEAFLQAEYEKCIKLYLEALHVASNIQLDYLSLCLLKYMLSASLLETDHFENIVKAMYYIDTIEERTYANKIPATYYLLAKAHYKLHRFDDAEKVLGDGLNFLQNCDELDLFYIPGTNLIIQETTHKVLHENLIKIKELCKNRPLPNYICSMVPCQMINKPYSIANRNIYTSDPAYNGVVMVGCNHKISPCCLTFHPHCWEIKKDYSYLPKDDQKVLNGMCVTGCRYEDEIAKINFIKYINKDNEETILKPSENGSVTSSKSSSGNGTIKKQFPLEQLSTKLLEKNLTNGKLVSKVQNDDDILVIVNDAANPKFYDTPEEKFKNFIFSVFTECIQANKYLTVAKIKQQYQELKTDEFLYNPPKDFDIIDFLTSTKKFKSYTKDESQILNFWYSNDVNEAIDEFDVEMNYYPDLNTIENSVDINESKNLIFEGKEITSNEKFVNQDAKINSETLKKINYQNGYAIENTSIITENNNHTKINDLFEEFIDKLNVEVNEKVTHEKMLENEISQLKEIIKNFKNEYKEMASSQKNATEELKKLKIKFDIAQKDNNKLEKETVKYLEENIDLQKKLKEISIKNNRQDIHNDSDCTVEIEVWKNKVETLQKLLSEERSKRLLLINSSINDKFTIYKSFLELQEKQCEETVEIVKRINNWLKRNLDTYELFDASDWMQGQVYIHKEITKSQEEYMKIYKLVNAPGADENLDIIMNFNQPINMIPWKSERRLNDLLEKVFECIYKKISVDSSEDERSLATTHQAQPIYPHTNNPFYQYQLHQQLNQFLNAPYPNMMPNNPYYNQPPPMQHRFHK